MFFFQKIRFEFQFSCLLESNLDSMKYEYEIQTDLIKTYSFSQISGLYLTNFRDRGKQGYNARKVNCSCVYSAYILKPVLSGQNL